MHSLQEILDVTRKNSNLCCAVERGSIICFSNSRVKGLCNKHYYRYKKYKSYDLPEKIKRCGFLDCENKFFGRGLCKPHYSQKFRKKRTYSKNCSVENCNNFVQTKELCAKHYARYLKYNDVDKIGKSKTTFKKGHSLNQKKINMNCMVKECDKNKFNSRIRRGLCSKHWQRWKKFGDYNIASKKEYLEKLKTN